MHPDPNGHRILVQDHMIGVAGGDVIVVAMTLRHDPEEHHAAGHSLQHIGEILRSQKVCRHWGYSCRRRGRVRADCVEEVDAGGILPALAAIGCCGSSRDWTHGVGRRWFADLPFGSSQAMLLWV